MFLHSLFDPLRLSPFWAAPLRSSPSFSWLVFTALPFALSSLASLCCRFSDRWSFFFSSLFLSLSLLVVSLISFSLSLDRCRCLALRRLRMLPQIWKPTFSKQERPFLPSAKGEFFHSPSTLGTLSFVFSHCAICSLVVSGQLPFQLWKRTLLLHTLCCAACTWGLLGYLHMERSLSNH